MREGDNIPVIQNNNIYELISNSKVAFINGQYHEAYYLANEAIKLDENCADAYQSVMRIQRGDGLLMILRCGDVFSNDRYR